MHLREWRGFAHKEWHGFAQKSQHECAQRLGAESPNTIAARIRPKAQRRFAKGSARFSKGSARMRPNRVVLEDKCFYCMMCPS